MSGAGDNEDALVPGHVLPGTSYRLVERIGRGAHAVVWRAEHMKLSTGVVVKLLDASANADSANRMRLEAQALARLSHPNLVSVVDAGFADGRLFYVMEDVGGLPLAQALGANGRMTAEAAIALVVEVLGGLGYVHAHGLVHRDLHPDNVLVVTGEDGARSVRILDLGLVKLAGGHERLGLTPLAAATAAGMTLGTPRYMAPEQARGAAVDARADLYAVGALLYRLLAGRDPFAHHATVGQILAAQLSEEPPPLRAFAPDLDPAIEREVLRALAKRPDDRHATAGELGEALARALAVSHLGVEETADARARSSWTHTVSLADPEPESSRALTSTRVTKVTAEPVTRRLASERDHDEHTRPTVSPERAPSRRAIDVPTERATEPQAPRLDVATPAPKDPSRARATAVFVASWLGVALVTVLSLVAARGCSGLEARTQGGSPRGERVSTR
jgi:serine/threonine-protein kinase